MRIYLKITPSDKIIPYNYQPMLTGAFHKWVGENDIHDDLSLYSFSWLSNGQGTKNGLNFRNGTSFFISAFDSKILKKIIEGIQNDPGINYGLTVKEVIVQEEPSFKDSETFFCASPVLIKRKVNKKEIHYTFKEDESAGHLTDTLKHKLNKAGLSGKGVQVAFDKDYHTPKTKVIYYNSIGNKVNICPLKISGTPEQIAFAWNVGIGNSTGIGFGALK